MATQVGALASRNAATSTIPLENRIKKYSPSDRVLFREFSHANLVTALLKRLQKRTVSVPQPYNLEDDYPTMSGTLKGSTNVSADTALTISLSQVIIPNAETFLQPGDVIHVAKGATNQSNTSAYSFGENMVVQQIETEGSSARVRVQRANGQGGTNTYGVTAASAATLAFVKLAPGYREGSGSPEAISESLSEGYNLNQIIKSAYAVTNTMKNTDMFGGDDFQRNARKARKVYARLLERAVLLGQRGIKYENGKPKRLMGGTMWWIANGSGDFTSWSATNDLVNGNGTSRVWSVGSVSDSTKWGVDKFIDAMEIVCRYGNSMKYCYCGGSFLSRITKMFRPMVRMENDEDHFGLNVSVLELPNGMLRFIKSVEMTEMGYGDDCMVLDLDFLGLNVMKGRDTRIEQNIQDNDADERKDQLIGEMSLHFQFWKSHSWITGLTA